ncbi:hypothetical protein CPC08DRAFT_716914 [Agrocybe pediades]|nr:hypothetical protein CPC08DRAFT_716914 [Agrocybe pediades]
MDPYRSDSRPEYPTPPNSFYSPSYASSSSQRDYTDAYVDYDAYMTGTEQGTQEWGPLTPISPPNNEITVSISTSFHPDTDPPPDTMISSSDGVLFYIDSNRVWNCCPTAFEPFLSAPITNPVFRETMITLDIPSTELNLMLHVLYGFSPRDYSPDFATIVRAVDKMPVYGLPPEHLVQPKSPLHDLLVAHAPVHPLDVYALAAHSGLRSLAVTVSAHLLSFDLSTISDPMAERIGAVYLNRLLLLHVKRFESLKNILLKPPSPHAPTKTCTFQDQRKLTRAWALVCAYLCWDSRRDVSAHAVDNALTPLKDHLECELCQETLRVRIKDVLDRWATVKASI